jgi:type IV secretory pathway VirB10-like protein
MRATLPLIALGVLLALSACSKKVDEPDAAASTSAVIDTPQPVPASEPTQAEITPEPTATAEPTPAPTSTAADSGAVATTTIPTSLRGRWGMVPKDCTSKLGDAKGLLTVSADQLKFYEAVAKLGKVKEADDSRIRATFRYSGEGQTWAQDVVLDAQDGGRTLIRRDYGPDALPGPQKYTRCT